MNKQLHLKGIQKVYRQRFDDNAIPFGEWEKVIIQGGYIIQNGVRVAKAGIDQKNLNLLKIYGGICRTGGYRWSFNNQK